jgi:MFS family permease
MTPMLTGMFAEMAPGARAQQASKPFVLVTMCLGVFLAQLDSTVVYLGVKHIGGELGASISQLQWVLDAYNLAYATFLLTGGALGDLYGRTRIFLCGIGLILLGSVICAFAPSGAMLIAGRVVTGLGAALELPVSLSILTVTIPMQSSAAAPSASGQAATDWRWRSALRSAACWSMSPLGAASSSFRFRSGYWRLPWHSRACRNRATRKAASLIRSDRFWRSSCWRHSPS